MRAFRPTALRVNATGLVFCLLALAPVLSPTPIRAQDKRKGITYQPARIPPFDEIVEGLRAWEQQFPDRMHIEEAGTSKDGRPILLCHITDRSVADEDKQRILFSTMHSAEVDGPVQILYMMKWLLGDDPQAAEIRRNQVVMIFPCMNPDSYTRRRYYNEFGTNLSWNGLRNPSEFPVGKAYDEVLRRYNPEAHVGAHSTSGKMHGWMTESFISGDALLRPSDPTIMDALVDAVDREGFAFVYGEPGKHQIRATRIVPGAWSRFHGQFSFPCSETSYAYHVTKGVPLRTEIGGQESFLVGMRSFMQIGNDVWRGERHKGYPVNRVAMVGAGALSAWGETAAQRRKSRVELWRKIGQISLGVLYPEQKGKVVAVYCSDPALRQRLKQNAQCLDGEWDRFVSNLAKEPTASAYELEQLREAGRGWLKPGAFWMQGGMFTKGENPLIEAGLCIRIHLPYPKPTVRRVQLDGKAVQDYVTYHNPGTIVEVGIPPGAAKALHIVSVDYEPDRRYKEGLEPGEWEFGE